MITVAKGVQAENGEELDRMAECFARIKRLEVAAHYRHLSTSSYAEHKALEKLYEQARDLGDRLMEAHLSSGADMFVPKSVRFMMPETIYEIMPGEIAYFNDATKQESNEGIKNVLADITEMLQSIRYLLSLR